MCSCMFIMYVVLVCMYIRGMWGNLPAYQLGFSSMVYIRMLLYTYIGTYFINDIICEYFHSRPSPWNKGRSEAAELKLKPKRNVEFDRQMLSCYSTRIPVETTTRITTRLCFQRSAVFLIAPFEDELKIRVKPVVLDKNEACDEFIDWLQCYIHRSPYFMPTYIHTNVA